MTGGGVILAKPRPSSPNWPEISNPGHGNFNGHRLPFRGQIPCGWHAGVCMEHTTPIMAISHCDFLLPGECVFDDRVTGTIETFAPNAELSKLILILSPSTKCIGHLRLSGNQTAVGKIYHVLAEISIASMQTSARNGWIDR